MRKFIFWPAVLLLTLFIGGITFALLNASFPSLALPSDANTQTIVVATKDISVRRSITESDLAVREVPLGTVPENAATSIDEIVGMMATSNILHGETILMQQIAVAGEVIQQIALTIPDNKILVPIPIQSQLISVGLVKPGDHVDLFGTFVADEVNRTRLNEGGLILASAENVPETVAVLQNLEVHAIIIEPSLTETNNRNVADDEENDESGADGVFEARQQGQQSILVALDRQDSLVVNHLIETKGQLDIVLRTPDDNALAEVTNVDLFYLANRYGIELVRSDIPVMTQELFQANPGEFIFTGTEPSPDFLAAIGEQ